MADKEEWIEINVFDAIILCRNTENYGRKVIGQVEEKMKKIIKSNDRWSLKKLLDVALGHNDHDHVTFKGDEEE